VIHETTSSIVVGIPGRSWTFRRVLNIAAVDTRAVVLVEGISDQVAIETLATRLGRDLTSEGVSVVSMGGVHAVGGFLARFGPNGANLGVAGLYDVGEEGVVKRALERTGFGSSLTRSGMEETKAAAMAGAETRRPAAPLYGKRRQPQNTACPPAGRGSGSCTSPSISPARAYSRGSTQPSVSGRLTT
jgi:hypothetical protein